MRLSSDLIVTSRHAALSSSARPARLGLALLIVAACTLIAPVPGSALATVSPPDEQPPASEPCDDAPGQLNDAVTGLGLPVPDPENPPSLLECEAWNSDLTDPDNDSFPSEAYPSWCTGLPRPGGITLTGNCTYRGSPFLNVELAYGVAASDYGPRSLDPVLSSYPMLAAQTPHYLRATPYMERPTFGSVDLITGVPLIQETDFELPFGSAVFRHTRTYSEMPGMSVYEINLEQTAYGTSSGKHPRALFWDWVGQGWMMGEAPLFLVDAAYWGVCGQWKPEEGTGTGAAVWEGNTTCYFMPDAHHAIPFYYIGDGKYESPSRFDAVLEQVGGTVQSGSSNKHPQWLTKPSKFILTLQGGAVKYTIVPLWKQDAGPGSEPEFHKPPESYEDLTAGTQGNCFEGRKIGQPYLGLVTAIDDTQGNRISFTYAPFEQWALDHPYFADCINCFQGCSEKGQLRRVQLWSRWGTSNQRLHWTLIYTHRQVAVKDVFVAEGEVDEPFMKPVVDVLHSIHVYRNTAEGSTLTGVHADSFLDVGSGDRRRKFLINQAAFTPTGWQAYERDEQNECTSTPDLPGVQQTPWSCGGGNPPSPAEKREIFRIGLEELATRSATQSGIGSLGWGWEGDPLPDTWEIEVQHLYDDGSLFFATGDGTTNGWRSLREYATGETAAWSVDPRLISTRVTKRQVSNGQLVMIEGDPVVASLDHTLYRYDQGEHVPTQEGSLPAHDGTVLRAIYKSNTLTKVGTALLEADEETEWVLQWPYALLGLPDEKEILLDRQLRPVAQVGPLSNWRSLADTLLLRQPLEVTTAFANDLYTTSGDNPWEVLDGASAVRMPDGISAYVERVGDNDVAARIHRFIDAPNASGTSSNSRLYYEAGGAKGDGESQFQMNVHRGLYHFPFSYWAMGDNATPNNPVISELYPAQDQAFWITVVDEYQSAEAMLNADLVTDIADQLDDYSATTESNETWTPPVSRRAIHMNTFGHALWEKSWDMKAGSTASSGAREVFERDEWGRIIKHKTIGWGTSANEGNTASAGLVLVHEFDVEEKESPPRTNVPPELKYPNRQYWSAIQSGDGATNDKYYVKQNFYRPKEGVQPETTTHQIVFLKPSATLFSSSAAPSLADEATEAAEETGPAWQMIRTYLQFDEDDDKRVIRKTVVQPPVINEVGAAEFPFEVEWYNYSGQPNWRSYGSFTLGSAGDLAADGSMAGVEIENQYFDFTIYHGDGYVLATSIDSKPAPNDVTWGMPWESGAGCATSSSPVDPYPDSLQRVVAGAPDTDALHYGTIYFQGQYGPIMTWHPNGRRDIVEEKSEEVTMIDHWTFTEIRRRTFKDVIYDSCGEPSEGAEYRVGSPGTEEVLYDDRRLKKSFLVQWPSSLDSVTWGGAADARTVISEADVTSDATGRPTKIKVTGANDGSTVEAQATYGVFGEVSRKIDPDGTITRTVANTFGAIERTYKGTKDYHPFWGNVAEIEDADDNMVLVEKNYFGTGVNDCRKPIGTRRFREVPTNQYSHTANGMSNEDAVGWLEERRYDWRMREVVSIKRAPGDLVNGQAVAGEPVVITFTYLDHTGRACLVATFDGSSPVLGGSLDPSEFDPGVDVPAATALLAANPEAKLLRLSQTVYNPRGLVQEQREYDVSVEDGTAYLATLTEYDWKDRPVRVRAPNAPEERSRYDALGRRTQHSLWSGGKELQRTLTQFDTDGNALVVTVWERMPSATATELGNESGYPNYVQTTTHNWYDFSNRLIASVDLGTSDSQDRYVHAQAAGRFDPFADDDWDLLLPNRGQDLFSALNDWYEADGIVHVYEYDLQGRQTKVYNPNGSITLNTYDDLGQLIKVRETEPGGEDPVVLRRTDNAYSGGKLVGIAAVTPSYTGAVSWGGISTADYQTTTVVYGAEVIDEGGTVHSKNNSLVHGIIFPHTDVHTLPVFDLAFQYYQDGLLATRTDRRGVRFTYTYDTLNRLIQTDVFYPSGYAPPSGTAPDRITKVAYVYDALGQLTRCTATGVDENDDPVLVAQTTFEHDSRGNLVEEAQAHGDEVGSTTPLVSYEWDYSPAPPFVGTPDEQDNFNRLVKITYPRKLADYESSRRQVSFSYGSAGSVDSGANRVIEITDHLMGRLSGYTYAGVSRRATTATGSTSSPASSQTYDDTTVQNSMGLEFLDRFGRPKVRTFLDVSSPVHTGGDIQRKDEYAYAISGERIGDRVTQQDMSTSGGELINLASSAYQYDKLSRLIEFGSGTLQSSTPTLDTGEDYVSHAWSMDSLGNWLGVSGSTPAPGLLVETKVGTAVSTKEITHEVRIDNALTSVETVEGSTTSTASIVTDLAGNMVADERFYYQYDAWNRLIQVNERDNLQFNSAGEITGGAIGRLVGHYAYDGLGRLIRRQAPFFDSGEEPVPTTFRSEHLYYDGVRRIQEVYVDPVLDEESESSSMGPSGEAVSIGEEGAETEGSPIQGESESGGGSNSLIMVIPGYVEREYVWGPDYVDEMVVQIAPYREEEPFGAGVWPLTGTSAGGIPFFVIQDPVNFDVLALFDKSGNVVEQYVWDPYGNILRAEPDGWNDPRPILNRAGHHGLFFDRLNQPVVLGESMNLPVLDAGAYLVGHVRNRTYWPNLGRWGQRDPNGTGCVGSDVLFVAGQFYPMPSNVAAGSLFVDGANLFAYVRSRPILSLDPSGHWSIPEMAATMGVKGLLIGGLMGGAFNGFATWSQGGSFWNGFATGAAIGGATGGAGMWGMGIASAFGPTAAGLFGGSLAGIAGSVTSQLSREDRVSAENVYVDQLTQSLMWQAIGGPTGGKEDAFFTSAFQAGKREMTSVASRAPLFANRGSTVNPLKGRYPASTLGELLAIQEVLANPACGTRLTSIAMNDKRWPARMGWIKMSHVRDIDGVQKEIHYNWNPRANLVDDPKVVFNPRK